VIIPVILIFLTGCGNKMEDLDTEIAVPVSVEELKSGHIEEYIETTGTVESAKNAILFSEISGYYSRAENPRTNKPFKLGDKVKKGEIIINLDNDEHEIAINIKSKQLNIDKSKDEYKKKQRLFEKGGVTESELRDANIALVDKKANYESGLLALEKLKIKAPFNGVIVDMPYYTPNTKINQGRVMAEFMDYSKMHLKINLPGKKIMQIKESQQVRITNYNIPDDTLSGTITEVSPAINSVTRTFKAFVEIDNPEHILRPGMFAKAEIIIAQRDSALVIPKDIILSGRSGKMVYIVDRGTARQRDISTGLENPDEVEVISGLEENDRYITEGFETLQNRSKVKIIR